MSIHKGVFVYNRVLFGIHASIGIFLNTFGERLKHIYNIRVYFNKILIFGNSEWEHLETFLQVLNVLKTLGLTVRKEKVYLLKMRSNF